MLVTADEVTGSDIAGPVVVIVFMIVGVVFVTGYRMSVMHRANRDYKTTKAALPGLRKGFWTALGRVLKVGLVVSIVLFALAAWWIRGSQSEPVESNPRPRITDRWIK